jgi:uncharacterized FAD-dependent dehydrogenase
MVYDAIIIGAGPSGLTAALSCQQGNLRYKIFEKGKKVEHRSRAAFLGSGVGGAGLYSDGKLSFYPSATSLWRLRPLKILKLSYDFVAGLLSAYGADIPEFPEHRNAISEKKELGYSIKCYNSIYLPIQKRIDIITDIQNAIGESLACGVELVDIEFGDRYNVKLRKVEDGEEFSIATRAIIFASGKLAQLGIRHLGLPRTFRRLEAGVRIQQKFGEFFLKDDAQLDPKLLLRDDDARKMEWRTFCCCRRGEIVDIDYDGIRLISGRADVAPTGCSNVGFLSRVTSADLHAWCVLESHLRQNVDPQRTSVAEFLSCQEPLGTSVGRSLGEVFSTLTREGMCRLVEAIGVRKFVDAELFAPAVEGIGYYPDVEENLKINRHMIWVAGDAAGVFRGLLGALVSGYFVGSEIVRATK